MIKFRQLLILVAMGLFAGSTLAAGDCGPRGHGRFVAPHMEKHWEKHRTRLHDKLKLSAEQEAAWKVFADKTKPPSLDADKMKANYSELRALPTPARIDRMISRMKERESRMLERAAAVKEFYAQLNPEQQKSFDAQGPRRGRR